jgi:hypothetical protein
MTNLTFSMVDVIDYIIQKLKTNSDALGIESEDVYYGDQARLPRSPAICVEAGTKTKNLGATAAARRTDNTFVIFIMIYHGEVRSPQLNVRDADRRAEMVELLLDQDPRLAGLVIHGYVTEVTSGIRSKANSPYRSSRVRYEGMSKTMIPL